tara:strand:+ start:122 stop:400 length:279 start_codon:yes stop_codon:yes gene_type:complete
MNDEENKTNQSVNEEFLVSDLKKSLDNTIQEASITLNELAQNIESTIRDDELRDETKKIVKNFSEDLRKSLEQASNKLIKKKNKKKFSKEEE